MKTPFIDTAARVIRAEADALNKLADTLDDRFRAAIDLMRETKGRVIITGIGKSGHIANKIAATLASTGTPAQFVHPAEASHGDLGMITRDDVVLAISNSGEAPELGNLIAYSRRYEIPLIGLTSREDSTLARQSDVILLLPQVAEACNTGVVPTTSTTMTLAMGDALAVALMEHRDFTAEHFRAFHPGGKLGAQLSLVRDLMHREDAIPLVPENAGMAQVMTEIGNKGFGVTGVTDTAGKLVGIITTGDLGRHMEGLFALKASDVMTRNPVTIDPEALAEKAVGLMNTRKITCLLVIDPAAPGHPAGLLHIHDCLRVGLG
ncbi:KpsF/GutQ family sugar-phosphate isomerase [Sulfitobacter sp. M57]|uniref:KpsF/GutQ family sugar-phosphate isomerase n=1 Tax=unclassified Sulfitobacter TaxID=196795 RepID=UPI0023E1D407|nr:MULTISPECIES: KpsF/GutQ family sugar-phosphate isomerase [unclassified Sulfitobacter]MDF3414916.1 KpsF/GutQ family sugar-phosphate isomerase [Sulfitobacter sp. KE5]MDF3422397.1 KpsF/GutQ family sugar-phosphate isomerase [Sulfitobacter sp. KE43]MDF3433462.1 KpsF/GutQ family sugar-phosphate isomerase [Sulfitobacter sp. KE42]MDF3459102.1 KpsF/GutQ family sugar-phosphate isomerase [Sulfitobacter sp. S74]MDF3463001.1 KpsF/GutQ family sugar-phosphate isomerase [Sulfitobacter sp. Ks18]